MRHAEQFDHSNLPKLSQEQFEQYRGRLMQPRARHLWVVDYRSGIFGRSRTLKTGFLAVTSDNPEDTTLYELTGVKLSDLQSDEELVLFEKLVQGDRGLRGHIKQYRGNDIIERLRHIPVEE